MDGRIDGWMGGLNKYMTSETKTTKMMYWCSKVPNKS